MRVLQRVSDAAHVAGSVVLALVSVSIIVNIVGRAMGHQFAWASELSGYGVVCATYLGLAYVLREGRHVKVELLTERLSPRARAVMRILGDDLFTVVFSVIIVWKSLGLTQVARQSGMVTPLLELPVWPLTLALPVGVALFGLEAAADALAVGLSLSEKGAAGEVRSGGSLEEV